MTKIKRKFAKDFKCSRCGKPAVVFVGLNDPDATDYPMCRKCADDWRYEVIVEVASIGEEKQ